MGEPTTYTLEAPGAVLKYDVRTGGAEHPVLLLVGAPMGAGGFAALAGQFADRTVVTYDPRGTDRSQRTDGEPPGSLPDEHAEDLRRLTQAVAGGGPADIFGSSGGAVNALVLVARYPGLIHTLVAHEPPAVQVLPDREVVLAACADIRQIYQRSGFGPAMAKFLAMVSQPGEIPPGFATQPAPDPGTFGLPVQDDGSRDHPLLGLHMTACVGHQHDFDALRAADTRIVLGVGAESGELLPGRAAVAVAERLGTTPVTFPGGHDGFVSDTSSFAAVLHTVLDE